MDYTRALYRMIHRYGPGTKALAACLDMAQNTLAHKASPTYPTMFFSPEEAMQLTEETNDNDFVNTVCAARGGIFMPIPKGLDTLSDGELVVVMRETAHFAAAVADARCSAGAGGASVTANELAEIEKEAADAISAIQECVRRARAEHQAAKPASLA